jgi:protease I
MQVDVGELTGEPRALLADVAWFPASYGAVGPSESDNKGADMANELQGKRIAFLATDGVEQVELTEPWRAVEKAGGTPELVSPETGRIQGFNHLDKGDTFPVDRAVGEAGAGDYDGLVLPGGVANPDFLRADEDAVAFVRAFIDQGKPVAAICHGPWTLVEADVVRGRTLTSWPSLKTDIRNAGGTWVDEELHVDDGLATSRRPDDLPAFCSAIVEQFSRVPSAH